MIRRFFGLVNDPFDPAQVRGYSNRVAAAVRAAQQQEMNLAVAQQRALLADLGVRLPKFNPVLPDEPRGVDPGEVAGRALRDARVAITAGADRQTALEDALDVALVRHGDDLDLGARLGHRDGLEKAPDAVIGYRRVIHPELSKTGTCGLCVAAADRSYNFVSAADFRVEKKDVATKGHRVPLLAVHARCKCTVAPVTETHDPGDDANQFDLGQLYQLAGSGEKSSTAAKDLSKVRYTIDEHGELGAQLRPRSKGAADPASQIAQIDTTLKGLGVWADRGVDTTKAVDAQLDHRAAQSARGKPGTGT